MQAQGFIQTQIGRYIMNELSMLFKVNSEGKDNLLLDMKTEKAKTIDGGQEKGFESELAGILGLNLFVLPQDNKIPNSGEIQRKEELGMNLLIDDTTGDSFESLDGVIKTTLVEHNIINTDGEPPIFSFDNNDPIQISEELYKKPLTPDLKSVLTTVPNKEGGVALGGLLEDTSDKITDIYSNILTNTSDEEIYLFKTSQGVMGQLPEDSSVINKGIADALLSHGVDKENNASHTSTDEMRTNFVSSNTLQKGDVTFIQDVKDGARGAITSENLVRQVGDKMSVLVKDGFSKATINLEPPSMGHLKVDIIVKDNMVRASIVADHQIVKEVLKANLSSLTDALTHQGFQVSELNVFLGDRGGGYRDRFDFSGGEANYNYLSGNDSQSLEEETVWQRNMEGAVDIFV